MAPLLIVTKPMKEDSVVCICTVLDKHAQNENTKKLAVPLLDIGDIL